MIFPEETIAPPTLSIPRSSEFGMGIRSGFYECLFWFRKHVLNKKDRSFDNCSPKNVN
jgi:hypothetical protein